MTVYSTIKRRPVFAGFLLTAISLYPNDKHPQDTVTHTRELEEVVVNGVKWGERDLIGRVSISGVEINSHPVLLGEHDLIKVLQTSSGVVAGTEGFAGLYVRGGETDQNLYLLDGLPLLNVYHLGGLFSTFSTHAIENVNFYKGAFPSLFGERASSIVDVALKQPDYYKMSGVFSIGLASGQLFFSSPLKKGNAAVSVALRRTWFDVFSLPALAIINAKNKPDGKKSMFNYNFTDALVKLSATDQHNNDFSLVLFYGKDNFKLGEQRFDPENEYIRYKDYVNKLSWGNWGASLEYRFFTPSFNLRIQPYVSRAFALDIQEDMTAEVSNENSKSKMEIKPSVLQVGMKEHFSIPIVNWIDLEAGLQQKWSGYDVGDQTESRNVILSCFGELNWNFKGVFKGSVGMRLNRYISRYRKFWNPEPRFAIKVNLPYESDIKVGYSRVAQYAQQVSSNYIYLPSDAWLPTASCHRPLICDIYSMGYKKKFKGLFSLNAEVWWKNMNNLAEYVLNTSPETATIPWNDKLTFGRGWAYGCDLELKGNIKSINWNVAYGLMWNWRKFSELNSGKRYPAKFDNRHKIDICIGWKINERLELNGQWEFMTGNRMTLALYNIASPDVAFPEAPFVNPLDPEATRQDGIDYYESRNNIRLPAFHRLNISLSLKGRINNKLTYNWDFGLYNAYCRMNPFTIFKNYINSNWMNGDRDYRQFKTLSLFPILPSISYTLNF